MQRPSTATHTRGLDLSKDFGATFRLSSAMVNSTSSWPRYAAMRLSIHGFCHLNGSFKTAGIARVELNGKYQVSSP
jgi:hypothetical protein